MPEYAIWNGMRQRCNNPSAGAYRHYGGRGIKVCPEWEQFWQFVADMGPRPSPDHTLERIDNDGDYRPSNCKWATRRAQSRNRRSNRLLTFNGRTQPMSAWADETGITYTAIQTRLDRGWSVHDALTRPMRFDCR
jgi:hypothetical protein